MRFRITSPALVIAFVLLFGQSSFAQAPSGAVITSVDSTLAPVWDLTGTFDVNQPAIGADGSELPLQFSIPLTLDARGRLTGSGLIFLGVNGEVIASDFTASGRVSGGGATTKVSLTVRLTGQDVVAGSDTPFKISVTYKLKVDREAMALVGSSRGSAKFTRLGITGSIKANDISIPLPPGVDGTWNIQMNLLPLDKLAGTGAFLVSNGRSLPTTANGSYSRNSNVSKLKLVGTEEGKGSSANVDLSPAEEGGFQIVKLRGKVLGQSVKQ